MSGISKRVSGSWVSGDYGIMKTATDTITTLPADLYADGNSATVGLKGNTVQNGTPTPQNPVTPNGTGERTENLFDKDNTIVYQGYFDNSGKWRGAADSTSVIIPVLGGTTYTLSVSENLAVFRIYETSIAAPQYGDTFSTIIRGENIKQYTFTTAADTVCIGFQGSKSAVDTWVATLVLKEGSTIPTSYIPYGIKIPILSANTTTPVYLGEVETTRKIYELVLTGQETGWQGAQASGGRNRFVLNVTGAINADTSNPYSICSHLPLGASGGTYSTDNVYTIASEKLYMRLTADYDTLIAFKQYLAQQYAAGTPVCVWYVLATPQTAIVNEPIRKIGEYADTVSGITIPTIAGADSFDVQTTLKPSEVSLSYTGWHDATVKEWDGSQWS